MWPSKQKKPTIRAIGLSGARAPVPVDSVAHLCYSCGMPRARISTTVDEELLRTARRLRAGVPDSVLVEEALAALIARNRAAEIDSAYAAYDKEPLGSSDEWGDLASFRAAAAGS